MQPSSRATKVQPCCTCVLFAHLLLALLSFEVESAAQHPAPVQSSPAEVLPASSTSALPVPIAGIVAATAGSAAAAPLASDAPASTAAGLSVLPTQASPPKLLLAPEAALAPLQEASVGRRVPASQYALLLTGKQKRRNREADALERVPQLPRPVPEPRRSLRNYAK